MLTAEQIRASLVSSNAAVPVKWPAELASQPPMFIKHWPLPFYNKVNDALNDKSVTLGSLQDEGLTLGLCAEDGELLFSSVDELTILFGPAADFLYNQLLDSNGFKFKEQKDATTAEAEQAKNSSPTETIVS